MTSSCGTTRECQEVIVTFAGKPERGLLCRLRQIVDAIQGQLDTVKDRKPGDPLPIGALVTEIRTDIPQRCVRVEAVVPAGYTAEQVQSELLALMRRAVAHVTEGMQVMQCHKSTDAKPRPCAGYLSVVGYESIGVRSAVAMGVVEKEDVGRPIKGLYRSLHEMLKKADHIDLGGE